MPVVRVTLISRGNVLLPIVTGPELETVTCCTVVTVLVPNVIVTGTEFGMLAVLPAVSILTVQGSILIVLPKANGLMAG